MNYIGTIFNNQTSERVPFTTVKFYPSQITVQADASGVFKLNNVAQPQTSIVMSHAEHETTQAVIDELRTVFLMEPKVKLLTPVIVKAVRKPANGPVRPTVKNSQQNPNYLMYLLIIAGAYIIYKYV